MRAAYIERFGGPEVIRYGDLPDPKPGAGEVVIDVAAASVNAADWKVRLGHYGPSKFPLILGRDFSGVVAEPGSGVSDMRHGDAVFGVCDVGQEGAYAEKVAVKAAIIAKKPADLSHMEAAALALTGLTALSAVEDTLKLQRGETILVQGGAGGVASIAIQLARHIGAHVITTASETNHDYVRGLGAERIIDYTKQDFTQAVRDCDAVFRHGGRRGRAKIVRGAQAGRTRGFHRIRTAGAEARAHRRHRPAPQCSPHPGTSATHRPVGRERSGARSGDQGLSSLSSRRCAPA